METLIRRFLSSVLLVGGITTLTTALMRCEKCRNLSVPNTRVCFFAYSLNSNELLGYLNLSDLYETWPKCSTHINARAKVCEAFTTFSIFYCNVPARDDHQKYFNCLTLQQIFSGANESNEKASHTLLAYHILIDIVQFI